MARRPVHVYRDTYSLETHRQNHDVNSITDRVAEQLYCIVVNKHTHTHTNIRCHKIIPARQLSSRSRLQNKRRCASFYCDQIRCFCSLGPVGVATSQAMFAADISKAIADMAAASTHLAERVIAVFG